MMSHRGEDMLNIHACQKWSHTGEKLCVLNLSKREKHVWNTEVNWNILAKIGNLNSI